MRGEEEQATDIKSNNPHLAGGEKDHPFSEPRRRCYRFCSRLTLTESSSTGRPRPRPLGGRPRPGWLETMGNIMWR